MPKRISHEEHNKRLNLWGKGYSDKKIARECNVSSQAIEKWRKSTIFQLTIKCSI